VGTLLDATGDFSAGFLSLTVVIAVVLALTFLLRPFEMSPSAAEA
jgi:flagellar biogenesis protein FliO